MGFVDWFFDYGDRQFLREVMGDYDWTHVSQKKQRL